LLRLQYHTAIPAVDFDHSKIGLASTNPSASRHPGLSRSSYLPACATGQGISTRSYLLELQPCNFVSHYNINTLHCLPSWLLYSFSLISYFHIQQTHHGKANHSPSPRRLAQSHHLLLRLLHLEHPWLPHNPPRPTFRRRRSPTHLLRPRCLYNSRMSQFPRLPEQRRRPSRLVIWRVSRG